MKGGFHGKTAGALSATWNKKYKEPFEPLLQGFKHVEFGSLAELEAAIDGDTSAVLLEPIQGEGGIIMPADGYLKGVREICDRRGFLLIADEIQTGLGRTGKLWACENWDVIPDVMTSAKGLAGGVPIGATVARKEILHSLKKGEQTSTFGGNPLACAAGTATLDYISKHDLPGQAAAKGRLFQGRLKALLADTSLRKRGARDGADAGPRDEGGHSRHSAQLDQGTRTLHLLRKDRGSHAPAAGNQRRANRESHRGARQGAIS